MTREARGKEHGKSTSREGCVECAESHWQLGEQEGGSSGRAWHDCGESLEKWWVD